MRIRGFRAVFLIVIVLAFAANAFSKSRGELVRDAVSDDESQRKAAISELRNLGPDGLGALLEGYRDEIEEFVRNSDQASEDWDRIAFALDSVAMQKDAYGSRLFWHTDIETAMAAAKLSGKPVLSLRLLGNLNEEFSCANSRFFRALLYSNSAISRYLRENYVLHWKSVRPAPKVTIDFGDGRKIERTLTGNSIHYVLSPNGEVIDALPGLYDPAVFLGYLKGAKTFSDTFAATPTEKRPALLNGYRRNRFFAIRSQRDAAVSKTKVKLREADVPAGTKATEVAPIAVTKMITEAAIIRDLDDNFSRFEPQIPAGDWQKLAEEYAGTSGLDQSSIAFVRRQNSDLGNAQFASMIAKLKTYIALDTTRNDFLYHTELLRRLTNFRGKFELERFNSVIYTELFKTPDADKWLGLYTNDVYTALDGNGIR